MASPQLRGQLQRGWRLSLQKEPRREDRDNGYKLHWVKFHFGMRKKFCGFFFVLRTISGTTSSGRWQSPYRWRFLWCSRTGGYIILPRLPSPWKGGPDDLLRSLATCAVLCFHDSLLLEFSFCGEWLAITSSQKYSSDFCFERVKRKVWSLDTQNGITHMNNPLQCDFFFFWGGGGEEDKLRKS